MSAQKVLSTHRDAASAHPAPTSAQKRTTSTRNLIHGRHLITKRTSLVTNQSRCWTAGLRADDFIPLHPPTVTQTWWTRRRAQVQGNRNESERQTQKSQESQPRTILTHPAEGDMMNPDSAPHCVTSSLAQPRNRPDEIDSECDRVLANFLASA